MSGTLTPIPPLPPEDVIVKVKPLWQSITVWVNVIGLLAAFLAGFLELDFIKSIPMVESWIVGLLGILNLILRIFKTSTPVSLGGKILTFGDIKKIREMQPPKP